MPKFMVVGTPRKGVKAICQLCRIRQAVAYRWNPIGAEDRMEPNTQHQSAEPDAAMEGDDLLDSASGGKGVNRNSFSLE